MKIKFLLLICILVLTISSCDSKKDKKIDYDYEYATYDSYIDATNEYEFKEFSYYSKKKASYEISDVCVIENKALYLLNPSGTAYKLMGFRSLEELAPFNSPEKSRYIYDYDDVFKVPAYINGLPVEEIGDFFVDTDVKTVILPPTVKIIDGLAFGKYQENIYGLENVEYVGERAFYECHAKQLVFSENLLYIGSKAFAESSVENLYFGSCVNYIGEDAFEGTKWLSNLDNENGTKYYKNYLLESSSNIIDIKDGTTLVQREAFSCDSVEYIICPESLKVIDKHTLFNRGNINNLCDIVIKTDSYNNTVNSQTNLIIINNTLVQIMDENINLDEYNIEYIMMQSYYIMATNSFLIPSTVKYIAPNILYVNNDVTFDLSKTSIKVIHNSFSRFCNIYLSDSVKCIFNTASYFSNYYNVSQELVVKGKNPTNLFDSELVNFILYTMRGEEFDRQVNYQYGFSIKKIDNGRNFIMVKFADKKVYLYY